MERDEKVSRKGYYYDLSISPYGYTSPYGDSYKLPSAKKQEIMEREAAAAIGRVEKLIERNGMEGFLPYEIIVLLHKAAINAAYKRIMR